MILTLRWFTIILPIPWCRGSQTNTSINQQGQSLIITACPKSMLFSQYTDIFFLKVAHSNTMAGSRNWECLRVFRPKQIYLCLYTDFSSITYPTLCFKSHHTGSGFSSRKFQFIVQFIRSYSHKWKYTVIKLWCPITHVYV